MCRGGHIYKVHRNLTGRRLHSDLPYRLVDELVQQISPPPWFAVTALAVLQPCYGKLQQPQGSECFVHSASARELPLSICTMLVGATGAGLPCYQFGPEGVEALVCIFCIAPGAGGFFAELNLFWVASLSTGCRHTRCHDRFRVASLSTGCRQTRCHRVWVASLSTSCRQTRCHDRFRVASFSTGCRQTRCHRVWGASLSTSCRQTR